MSNIFKKIIFTVLIVDKPTDPPSKAVAKFNVKLDHIVFLLSWVAVLVAFFLIRDIYLQIGIIVGLVLVQLERFGRRWLVKR